MVHVCRWVVKWCMFVSGWSNGACSSVGGQMVHVRQWVVKWCMFVSGWSNGACSSVGGQMVHVRQWVVKWCMFVSGWSNGVCRMEHMQYPVPPSNTWHSCPPPHPILGIFSPPPPPPQSCTK